MNRYRKFDIQPDHVVRLSKDRWCDRGRLTNQFLPLVDMTNDKSDKVFPVMIWLLGPRDILAERDPWLKYKGKWAKALGRGLSAVVVGAGDDRYQVHGMNRGTVVVIPSQDNPILVSKIIYSNSFESNQSTSIDSSLIFILVACFSLKI